MTDLYCIAAYVPVNVLFLICCVCVLAKVLATASRYERDPVDRSSVNELLRLEGPECVV